MTMTFVNRMMGGARLDAATYEEMEGDATALDQALVLLLFFALAGPFPKAV
jgi:hypothetical protein